MMNYEKDNLIYWVWLTMAYGPAEPKKWELCGRFGSAKQCYDAVQSGLLDGFSFAEKKNLKSATLEQAKKVLSQCEEKNVNVYGFESEGYPELLKNIYNPPSVIFSYGNLDFLSESVTLGVVGARRITPYSEKVTASLCKELASSGIVIISGFANGVDHTAHQSAINAGGKTVAVLGCGLDHEYPKDSNEFKKIVSGNGAVVSEYFLSTPPNSQSFKARNRILSGLSRGVLITQASKTSGSLNTASYAVGQGRDLFCVPPHDIFSTEYAGVAALLRDGAVPVFSHRDILYEYYADYSHKLKFTKDQDAFSEKSDNGMLFVSDIPAEPKRRGKSQKTTSDDVAGSPKEQTVTPSKPQGDAYDKLSDIQKKIVDELDGRSALADELADKLGMEVSQLFTELTTLEMDGYLKSLAGNRFELNDK